MKAFWVLACVIPLMACEEVLEVAEEADVRVEADDDALIVTNGRWHRIFYYAVDAEAPIVPWSPCIETSSCPSLPPQTITRVPYSQVRGGNTGNDIFFYWWQVTIRAESAQVDAVHMLRVRRR
jgi:hypothetical protein